MITLIVAVCSTQMISFDGKIDATWIPRKGYAICLC